MSGSRNIPPSRPRRDDGWLSDDQSALYREQPDTLAPDQPTMPLASPYAGPAFVGQARGHDQPDEAASTPPDETSYQRRGPSRPAHRGPTSDDQRPRRPRDTWEEHPAKERVSDLNRGRPAARHSSKLGSSIERQRKLPTFGGGLRGRILRVTGLGGILKSTRQGLSSQALRVLRRRAVLSVVLLVLAVCALAGAVDGLIRFSQTRADANAAMGHIHNIEALVPSSDDLGKLLDPETLQRMKYEIQGAQHAFALLQSDLSNPGGTFFIADHAPVTGSIFHSAVGLVDAANHACFAGLDLVNSALLLSGVLKAGFFASSPTSSTTPPAATPPPLNATLMAQLQHNIEDAISHLNLAASAARNADLSVIPSSLVKPKQLDQIRQVLANWPQIQTQLAEVDLWVKAAPELLGVTAPESFLIELMDRSELRSTGGFIGNYAVMTLKDGQIQPFDLRDVYLLDLPFSKQDQLSAPSQYPWWPFGSFGLRDTNISASFPTAAQLGMKMLNMEGGGTVQGVIALTPPTIARILKILGPIYVSDYKETVTDQNLEHLIHYYQQTRADDPVTGLPPGDQISSTRKNFTALLARAFIQKLHGLPTNKLVDIVKALLTSLQTKDLEVYLNNKTAQALLAKHNADGSITQGPGDGVTIIDSNVSVNKGSQFNVDSYTDHITLDAQGTATHDLTITYGFKVTDPSILFGPDHYKVYLRVYVPTNAKLVSLSGLDFGHNELNASDEPGRQMWGGFVIVQDGQPYSLHIVWSVPNAATVDNSGHWHYQLVFQHQAGSNQRLALTITEPGANTPALSYNGKLDVDKTYRLTYST